MTDSRHTGGPPRVFSIPASVPFLPAFVSAFLAGALGPGSSAHLGPLDLTAATIFVPTRRSARALATVFAQQLGSRATFLPRILPLADAETAETASALDPAWFAGSAPSSAVDDVSRRLILMRLIMAWASRLRRSDAQVPGEATTAPTAFRVAGTPADVWHLSGELADLLDALVLVGVDAKALAPLGTDAFDRYWGLTLDFLRIATEHWPAILSARGQVDPAARRKSLLEQEIARLLARPAAAGPVFVAGAFGSDPLTLRLLSAIAHLPQGAIVLPDVDQHLDRESWALIGASSDTTGHPQWALHQVLSAAGIERSGVSNLAAPTPAGAARAALVSEAFRPAETTDAWSNLAAPDAPFDRTAALGGVSLIDAAHEGEEALALAVALRESLEGGGSAVLVTPDRTLARRVREELLRWEVEIDDSGGEPLSGTPAGALAQLALDCLTDELDPVTVLSLLAHPAFRLGRIRAEVDRLRRWTERRLLRGVVPKGALGDPAGLIAKRRQSLSEEDRAPGDEGPHGDASRWAAAEALLADLLGALDPLRRLHEADLDEWLATHETAVANLTRTETAANALDGVDGTRLAALFAELRAAAEPGLKLDLGGYAALFGGIAAETVVRGPARSHPRLKILGLLEFRLLDADRVCLGGLDEGTWPPAVKTDAFLNRPMRQALGLPAPEQRIGQFAHDFTMALGAADVIISRATKRGGSPTVPSRFLQRLAAVAGERDWSECRARGQFYLDLARTLDRPGRPVVIGRPAPKPPVELRPTQLSVTRIETLRRDPYAIYAERILKLRPLDPIGAGYGPREWGTAFHDVLRDFVDEVRHGPVAADALAGLLDRAETAFAALIAEPHTQAFMKPRLERWVRAFHDWDRTRRDGLAGLHAEGKGRLDIVLDDGSVFELTATADRIERSPSGGIRLVDYKTGATPTKKEVAAGFAPQLTLEAAIALGGGFAALDAVTGVDEALYMQFGTGREITSVALAWTDRTLDEVVAEHLSGLRDLLNGFRDPSVGYVARPYPQFLARFGDYDHLSRIKEWSATGGLGDPTGDAP